MTQPLLLYALRRADDALILGHRLSEWLGHGPTLEEEMALGNIGLDLIGQARSLYQYAAQVESAGRDEDQLAYLRDVTAYRNVLLVELPNGDFAHTMVRQLLYSAFADPYWRAMTASADETLAAIAAKSEKESAYHLRHASEWVIRLGDGTDESHRRANTALEALAPYGSELFEADAEERALIGGGALVDPASIRPAYDETLRRVLSRAGLTLPAVPHAQSGGRAGRHTEHLGHLLAVMQHLQRAYPGAQW